MSEFKTYIGTKRLKGRPMTKGKYNNYRNWSTPTNENPAEEGYLVEYLDGGKPNDVRHEGYISWSPKDVFEKAYFEDKETTFLERLIIEEEELSKKIVGLTNALTLSGFAEKVGNYQFELLNLQHTTMVAYQQVLNIRIKDLSN